MRVATGTPRSRHRTAARDPNPTAVPPTPIERLAFLLSPPGAEAPFLPAGPRWTIPDRSDGAAVWGGPPRDSSAGMAELLRGAVARERALARLKRTGAAVHRLRPPVYRSGRLPNALRGALLGGAIVELPAGPSGGRPAVRVLDAAAADAGVAGRLRAIRASAAGAALGFVDVAGARAVLRVAGAGFPGDPAHAAEGLVALREINVPVPRLLGRGVAAGSSWSTETALAGSRPARLDSPLASAAAWFAAALPQTAGPPASLERDVAVIAEALPSRGGLLAEVAAFADRALRGVPAVMRHGDFWLGNLLVDGRRLTGVVDWDSWHAGGVPGADLLQLFATDLRIRARREMGEIWLKRPWRAEAFRRLTEPYWTAVGWIPSPRQLESIGVAWWAGEIAGTLTRVPGRSSDRRWTATNIDRVLAALTS